MASSSVNQLAAEVEATEAGLVPETPGEPADQAPGTLDYAGPETESGEEESLKRRTVRSGAWQLGAFGVQNIVRFGSNLVLARLVDPRLFGLSAVVTVVLVGLQMFSDVGIGPSIVQNKKGEKESFLRTAFTVQVLRGVVLFLIGCAISYPVSLYTGEPVHLYLIPLAGLIALLDGLRSTNWFRLQRRLRMVELSLVQAGYSLLGVAGMIVWAAIDPTVWALVVPIVIAAAVQTAVSHFLLRDRHDRLGWDQEAARELFSFGGWIFVSTALAFLATSTDRLLFAGMISMAELGVYNIAFVMATMPTQALLRLGSAVIFPAYANVKDDPERFARVFAKVRVPLTLAAGYSAAGLIGAGQPLIDALYPPQYEAAGWMLQVLAIAGWLQVLQTSNDAALLATGRSKWVALGQAIKFASLLAGILIGWQLFGFPGAVAGVAVADFIRYLASAGMMRYMNLSVLRHDTLLSLWITVSAVAAMWIATLIANPWLALLASGGLVTLCWLPAAMPIIRWFRNRGAPQ